MLEDCIHVLDAKTSHDLFGVQEKRSKIIYRRLARAVHPDLYPEADKKTAEKAFIRLTELWESHLNKTADPLSGGTASSNTIKTKRHNYSIGDKTEANGMYSRYHATYDAGFETCDILVTNNPADADLTSAHISALKKLASDVPEKFRGFYPELVESFRYRTPANTDHAALAVKVPEGFSPFSKILEVYPEGIDGRDVAWIFKRMLTAVGNAHDAGLIHGAPNLDSFLIHPELHGVILSDWQYSVEAGNPLKAVSENFKSDYPAYVFNKVNAGYSLDINLCAKTAKRLLRPDAPRQFNAFFRACELNKTLEAKYLLKEFDDLLERLYGKPAFHPFTLDK